MRAASDHRGDYRRTVACLALAGACAGAEIPGPGENLARGKSYTLDPAPNYVHCTDADDRSQLTDGQYAQGYFWTQRGTVGWQHASAVSATIDLGENQPIRGASFNTAAGCAGVEWPFGITVLVSEDGRSWHRAGELTALSDRRGAPPAEGYAVHRYWTDALRTHGRFVSFVVDPGGPYLFADELEVYRGEAAWIGLPYGDAGVTNREAYRLHLAVARRLRDDLRAVRAMDRDRRLASECDTIEQALQDLPGPDGASFRAVLPLNDAHERIFRAQAALWSGEGRAAWTVWAAHPWDPLSHTAAPPRGASGTVRVALMRNEYRAAAFNIARSRGRNAEMRMRIAGLPGGANPSWIAVHEVAWTDTRSGQPVAAALPPARREGEDYLIAAPAGLVRQVWLTLHPTDVAAGTHRGTILLRGDGFEQALPLEVRVSPLRFPDRPTLHVGGWDYTDADTRYEVTPRNREALIAHLRERFVDSPWATAAVLPADRDTSRFDRWVARWPDAGRYCVFAAVGDGFQGAAAGTPAFDQGVGGWIGFWADHARKRGLHPSQLALLLVDEPHDAAADRLILAWAKAIRAAATDVKIWEDPTHRDPAAADPEMMARCDVLCPNRPMLLAEGPAFRAYYAGRRAAGTELALYSCSGPSRLLDPYAYYRLQAWTCWELGAEGSYFWAFGDSGGGSSWNEYAQSRAVSYTPLFLDADSVTPGKHMEAIRESVEDFEYLVMLRARLEDATRSGRDGPAVERARALLAGAAGRVLGAAGVRALQWKEPKDRAPADAVRLEILDALAELTSP